MSTKEGDCLDCITISKRGDNDEIEHIPKSIWPDKILTEEEIQNLIKMVEEINDKNFITVRIDT